MDLKLEKKKILIIGGTKGIGRAITLRFASEQALISICGRKSKNIKATLKEAKEKGTLASILYFKSLNALNKKQLSSWVEKSAEILGGIDILIYTVSAQSYDWEKMFQLDLMSCVQAVDLSVPHLEKSKHASIVIISSVAASLKVPSYKPYSSIKAALISYVGSLSSELIYKGIRVNAVSPSEVFFKDGFWDKMKTEAPKLYKTTLKSLPLSRFARPEEVADLVTFLSSPIASYITGNNLIIDGGSSKHVRF